MALDGGLIKEADGCPQWFLSLRSVGSARLGLKIWNMRPTSNKHRRPLRPASPEKKRCSVLGAICETNTVLSRNVTFEIVHN